MTTAQSYVTSVSDSFKKIRRDLSQKESQIMSFAKTALTPKTWLIFLLWKTAIKYSILIKNVRSVKLILSRVLDLDVRHAT
jgi:hypothetical protein